MMPHTDIREPVECPGVSLKGADLMAPHKSEKLLTVPFRNMIIKLITYTCDPTYKHCYNYIMNIINIPIIQC